MKVNELRLGNYVEHEDPGEIVEGIHFIDKDIYRILIGNHLRPVEDIKPVPLTKEWLLKFSFDLPPNGLYPFTKKGVHVYLNKIVPQPNLKYVHQLQNLYFALTGEELVVKE